MRSNIAVIADGKETITIVEEYSQEELNKYNEKFANLYKEISVQTENMKPFQDKIKELKSLAKEILDILNKGFKEKTEEAYYIDEQELGERQYFNQSGEQIHSRKLKSSERQLKTKFMHESFN